MHRLTAIGASLAVAVLGGCQMLDSQWLDTDPAQAGTTCHSNAGTYHLPRRLITVSVGGSDKLGFSMTVDKTGKNAPYVADRNETYCLDFLLSYLSADRVGVQRSTDGLLQRIFTQADDKTADIAKSVIQGAADLIASDRANSLARSSQIKLKDTTGAALTGVVAQFQFDPFVEREAREVNNALIEFGYCVYIDPKNDPFAPPWSQEICRELIAPRTKTPRVERPYRGPSMVYKADPAYPRSGLPIFDPRPVPQELQARGVLYRPELSHSLVVVRKLDPRSRFSEWRVAASDRIVVPNAAPAFILEVERAIFVKAETDVQFSSGLIKSISINKPSELLVAADLAVAAAQIVVNIPAQTLKIFNNRTENTIALINTNADLIQLLRTQKADANLEAFGAAAAQAQVGTGLILGGASIPRSSGRTFNSDGSPEASRLAECLRDPAVQQYPDPLRVCQEIVNRGL